MSSEKKVAKNERTCLKFGEREWKKKNCCMLQEIRNSGASGYKFISVDEDEAACVVYANNTLLHLSMEQIPKGSAVS